MKYVVSEEAVLDLEKIWLYTYENWSQEQAERYYNLIIDEIEILAKNPDSGIDYSNVRKGYFKSRVKYHFIFYKINTKKNVLEIIRILHQQMDIDTHLDE